MSTTRAFYFWTMWYRSQFLAVQQKTFQTFIINPNQSFTPDSYRIKGWNFNYVFRIVPKKNGRWMAGRCQTSYWPASHRPFTGQRPAIHRPAASRSLRYSSRLPDNHDRNINMIGIIVIELLKCKLECL